MPITEEQYNTLQEDLPKVKASKCRWTLLRIDEPDSRKYANVVFNGPWVEVHVDGRLVWATLETVGWVGRIMEQVEKRGLIIDEKELRHGNKR